MRRADLVVLPYREIDQSGVAFTALGAGVPLLLSDVGGFPELAATGAARTFPAGTAPALRDALASCSADPAQLRAMAERARAAAAGPYAWEGIAARTLALYEQLLRQNHVSMRTALEIVFWVCVALIVWTQLGYAARARAARARVLRGTPPTAAVGHPKPPLPSLSLIVAAHDEQAVIAAKVANALALDYPRELLR